MHTHHSHSGDYVSHATGTLEQMVKTAQEKQFTHVCLTEHMPRLDNAYLYPEELEKQYTIKNLDEVFTKYLKHANEIKTIVNTQKKMTILVGFEVEGLDTAHIQAAKKIAEICDMCIGSVHYVHGIPIDFDVEKWIAARDVSGSTRQLYKDYFDLQYEVLTTLNPQVIGHFDLIRLFQIDEVDPSTGKNVQEIDIQNDWPDVWLAITRNIEYASSYGGLFELNSAAIRKGWSSPYPRKDISDAIIVAGGKFCLSDDAHTYAQVGLNYHKVWDYVINELKLEHIYHLDLNELGKTVVAKKEVSTLSKSPFWQQYN
ncbi:CIC11C00000004831 [Sungouiella intermedia]|uniref:Histidinol-phosphatase n=1 Tax=Sungouiella intermedia TaxID=45354 RepID=A0A1L0B7N9_9ASCO|nr:CIC11C00000004831 [[Candida] intermedia]